MMFLIGSVCFIAGTFVGVMLMAILAIAGQDS